MTCTFNSERLFEIFRSADEKVVDSYWVKCPLCLGFNVFDFIGEREEREEWMRYGHCRCGCRLGQVVNGGIFPRWKVLIWDEVEVREGR